MSQQATDILKAFSPRKIFLPIGIGLAAATYLLLRNFDAAAFATIDWTWYSSLWIFISFLMVVIRDWAYMYRIRVLTEKQLSWKQCFEVIMLWEFSSAIAPAILGGGFAFAILIISKEKIKMGKSIAVVMFTSFLDGLFFAIMAPLIFYTLGEAKLFSSMDPASLEKISNGREFYLFFWIVYFVVLFYKAVVAYALFINPRAVKYVLLKIFSIPLLRKWKQRALQTGTEMEIASRELQGQSWGYWIKSFTATFVSWTARYVIVNCIVMAFTTQAVSHLILYARQVVMGLIMLGSPTPGGSGVAELIFSIFLGEFIPPGLAPSLALLWRLISYYPYLFIGAIILPRWVRRVFARDDAASAAKRKETRVPPGKYNINHHEL
jgi:glycosyltransferase 2 family protein